MTACSSRSLSLLRALFFVVVLVIASFGCPGRTLAQTELAGVSGRITDASGAVIVDAEVEIKNVETSVSTTVKTNQNGLYTIPSLHPGHYLINVRKTGFRSVTVTELTLNVQDNVVRNFALQIGSVSETVTITADQLNINTTDGTVSTVVDRNFAENLPMNGRSFQTLVELTPGIVLTPSTSDAGGQFSVNGQRPSSNYWMVDGVSANIGIGANNLPADGAAGTLQSFSVLGGTNSLVSVDALQEFRIQTSTYAPEFGRAPGGQISIATRSGANNWHGTAFDYLRNDVMDANNWFADSKGLPKPRERQNDFGGTVSGPIFKNHTFFFFSYEGLRLRLPQTALTTVPSLSARQAATAALQPFLKAYPSPNGPEILNADGTASGQAPFNVSFSNRASLDATSLRIDHKITDKLNVFARYNYSPSELQQRPTGFALSVLQASRIKTQTATVGSTWSISPIVINDFRFNYSRNDGRGTQRLDDFGGAVPLASLPLPMPFTAGNASFQFGINNLSAVGFALSEGILGHNLQRQLNFVDSVSVQLGSHSLKMGGDYRRLTPFYDPAQYIQSVSFTNVSTASAGTISSGFLGTNRTANLILQNVSLFAQDTWHLSRRLTVTYGLRWDVDVSPDTSEGPKFAAVNTFDNLSAIALAPDGTPVFQTTYSNVAPRVGVAYQFRDTPNWETVLRGGFGIFYDLATTEIGEQTFPRRFPFGVQSSLPRGSAFPLTATASTPPVISTQQLKTGTFTAYDPGLQLPYTMQWNATLEQGLGRQQTFSLAYLGAVGRRLLQSEFLRNPDANFLSLILVGNNGTSDYDALQAQFERRLSRGLQALASYSWAHSIDTGSASSTGIPLTNVFSRQLGISGSRAPSDFDIRHEGTVGLTYDLPKITSNLFAGVILSGWSLQNIFLARSAPPVTVKTFLNFQDSFIAVRPDVVAGQPLYLFGPQYPGSKAINAAAFTNPPLTSTGAALREGTLSRNALRAFGAWQWDFGVHRDFPLHEQLKLQFRAEIFNILNHPNFGSPVSGVGQANFGISTTTLSQSLGGSNQGGGGFNPLYQFGAPRSAQLALKLTF